MSRRWDPTVDMPDLNGKVALVTGANTGIGFATVKFLALRGAKVYLAARSESRATKAVEQLYAENPTISHGHIIWLPLDLSDMKAVVGAVDEMKRKEQKLDILVNNAGIGLGSFQVNDAGWEMVMAVCHVGHFVLTLGLLPLLKQATKAENADVRVITVSSMITTAMVPLDIDLGFDSPTFLHDHKTFTSFSWNIMKWAYKVDVPQYSMAKMANVLFAREFQRLLDSKGIPIISISLHPGGVCTEGAMAIFSDWIKPLIRLIAVPVDDGAVTPLFAATAEVVRFNENIYKGNYLVPYGDIGPVHPATRDEIQLRGLWKNTLTEVNHYLASKGIAAIPDV